MSRKRYTPEQIRGKSQEAEVPQALGADVNALGFARAPVMEPGECP
jgi:hypothetical protein